MKICKNCKLEQDLNNFYSHNTCRSGYSKICKFCFIKKYYKPTPNKKICKICKIKITSEIGCNSGLKRKDGSIIYGGTCKKCIIPYKREYAEKRRNNINIRLIETIKSRINIGLRKNNQIKNNKIKYLGCPIDKYKQHLEKQFYPEMTWENYGGIWEIDHKIPISKFDLTEEKNIYKAFNYKNTQPLFKTTEIARSFGYNDIVGNREKGNKIT